MRQTIQSILLAIMLVLGTTSMALAQEFDPGNPNEGDIPGCSPSGQQPKKCDDEDEDPDDSEDPDEDPVVTPDPVDPDPEDEGEGEGEDEGECPIEERSARGDCPGDDPSSEPPTDECPTDGTPCHGDHDDIEIPRDCASGPDIGSDEWNNADEWRAWYEENCTEDDDEVELGDAVTWEKGEDEPATVTVSAASREELPRTGIKTWVLALLAAALFALGGGALRTTRSR